MSKPKVESPTVAQRESSQGAKRAWHRPELQTMSIADITENSGVASFLDPAFLNS